MPAEVRWAKEWRRILPYAGGLWDQPAGLLSRAQQAETIYEVMRAYATDGKRAGQRAAWQNAHPEWMVMVSRIEAMRREQGARSRNG